MSKSLQLVDVSKLNTLLTAFDQERKERKLLQNVTDPEFHSLALANDKMHKKAEISESENNAIHFIGKKQRYRENKKKQNETAAVAAAAQAINQHENNPADNDNGQLSRPGRNIDDFMRERKLALSEKTKADLID